MFLKFNKFIYKQSRYGALKILRLFHGFLIEVVLWHCCYFPSSLIPREGIVTKFTMERPFSHNHSKNYTTERRVEGQTYVPRGFMVESVGHESVNQLEPPRLNYSEVKPVHNYSIQTGEEFALEFMRDRVNPIKTPVNISGDTVCSPGHTVLGIPHVASQGGSAMTMPPISERDLKESDRKSSSFYEATNNYSSAQSKSQNLSSYNIYHSGTYASSGASEGLSSKLKILCSFAGKILPRPSDGKLRYVGGETRIIRIKKDISWKELWRKTTEIYNQTHTIKYQLPGEDLDALVSVSGDEDLQNMMDECNVLEDIDGKKKLRMFLFSIYDLDDVHLSLSNSDAASEIRYVVAINGMDIVSRQHSGFHGLASSSANNLEELDSRNVMRETSRVTTDFDNVLHNDANNSHAQQHDYSSNPIHSSPSEIAMQQTLHGLTQQDVADRYSQSSIIGTETQAKEIDLSTHQQGQENENSADEHAFPSNLHENNVKHFRHVKDGSASDRDSSKDERKVEEPAQFSVQLDASTVASVPYSSANDYYSGNSTFAPESITSVSSQMDLSYFETSDLPQRVFYSERIPRHQGELLNRSSKSDDLHSSPYFMGHSHPDASQKSIESETVENLQNENLNRQGEQSDLAGHAMYKDPQTFDNGLTRMKMSNHDVPSSVDAKDALLKNLVLMPDHEISSLKTESDDIYVNERSETGPGLAAVERGESDNKLDDSLSVPNIHRHDEAGSQSMTKNTHGHSQSLSGSSVRDGIHAVSSSAPSRSERGDILIDINDRFPRNLLSDIFTKATISDSSSNVGMLQKDGAGLSLNIENPEPKRWSFFQKLAGDEFVRKDVSLIDQDHIGFVAGLTKDEDFSLGYNVMQLQKDELSTDHTDPPNNFYVDGTNAIADHANYNESHIKATDAMHYDDLVNNCMMIPDSEYEGGIVDLRLPPLDPPFSDFDISSLQIIRNDDLEELRELGSGTFGTVYHGKWRGTDVAIKRIKKSCFTGRSSEQERLTIEFWREAEILSKLHHPNVVAFYGVVQDGPGGTLATVAEFMVDGSLRHVLLRKDRHLDRRKRLIIAMDAAFGMEYLHSKNIVHFDLKCDNLLVNLKDPSRPICKVADFGLSKIKRNTLVSGGVRGTLPWMAPELLNGGTNKVSEKVDVFSFGIVLWEILTGEEPYANMHYGAIIGGIVNNTLRPPIPSFCDGEWRKLMEQCWAPNPAGRPSFTEIASRLRVMSTAAHTKAPKASN
ncbi:non-receptor serine/threonine protein kinase [Lithospermum erythrorhizon]|uniref:Non-receptor serine/threonine protein kinase n=1 Tax=Lithospermum erythrorhizon TaxID=34254 RepID=A0AAV3RK25_LITER